MTRAEGGQSERVVFSAEFFRSYAGIKALPASLAAEIAFVGRSNAGKSSLLNALVRKKDIARTSGTPGKTQLLNFFTVQYNGASLASETGDLCFFVDLPGYGYAKVSKGARRQFQRFIDDYLTERRQLRAIVLVCDCRREPEAEEKAILALRRDIETMLVLTKADKLSGNERTEAKNRWTGMRPRPSGIYFTSAKDREKLDMPRLRLDIAAAGAGLSKKAR